MHRNGSVDRTLHLYLYLYSVYLLSSYTILVFVREGTPRALFVILICAHIHNFTYIWSVQYNAIIITLWVCESVFHLKVFHGLHRERKIISNFKTTQFFAIEWAKQHGCKKQLLCFFCNCKMNTHTNTHKQLKEEWFARICLFAYYSTFPLCNIHSTFIHFSPY